MAVYFAAHTELINFNVWPKCSDFIVKCGLSCTDQPAVKVSNE
jgi:hypothetical protein